MQDGYSVFLKEVLKSRCLKWKADLESKLLQFETSLDLLKKKSMLKTT